ncbi:MAG: Uncharacterised protein [Polaribacter sejongensis]|nr:MAG: Uncharacterised protein [Polaribacter sejongensis]
MAGHRYISSTERYLQDDLENLHEIVNNFHPINYTLNKKYLIRYFLLSLCYGNSKLYRLSFKSKALVR